MPRLQPVGLQRRAGDVRQRRSIELTAGHVDADENIRTGAGIDPRARLAAGLLQHPGADRHDEAGLLGDRDEVHRRDHAAGRVVPTHQGLEARQIAGIEIDDRLIEHEQLFAAQGLVQVGLDPQPVTGAALHFWVEHDLLRRRLRRAPCSGPRSHP